MPDDAMNTELPGGSPTPATSALPPGHPLAPLDQAHQQAKAVHGKVEQASGMLATTRAELDKLAALGDAVTSDDVLEGMSKLVAAGADPKVLLALMAGNPAQGTPPMPESGQALAGWIAQQDQVIKAQEAQIGQIKAQTQHDLGVKALQVLSAHHMLQKGQERQQASQPSAPTNPLLN